MNRVRGSLGATVMFVAASLFVVGGAYTALRAQAPEPPNPFLLIAGTTGSVGFGRVDTTIATPISRILVLQNGSQSTPLTLTSPTIGGVNPGDFALGASTCTTIAPLGSCQMTITFKPSANGERSARLIIGDDAGGAPHLVPLSGWGVDPSLPQLSVGPIDPRVGFPVSYNDGFNNLQLCLGNEVSPTDGVTTLCLGPAPNPAIPPSLTDDGRPVNFPDEAFYWSADAAVTLPNGADALLVLAQEAAFINGGVKVGDQMVFGRLRIRLRSGNIPAHSFWRFTHPFGVDEYEALPATEGDPQGDIFVTSDIGCFSAPCDFSLALTSRVSRFLKCVAPAPPAGYVGDPAATCTVTGSPTGFNAFKVEQITGFGGAPTGLSAQTDEFTVTGKIGPTLTSVPPASAIVPAVIGQTEAAARTSIAAAGLLVGLVTGQASTTVPAGVVIGQNPAANASVPLNTAVALVVSLGGSANILLPDVVGQPQASATSTLSGLGLDVTSTTQNSTTVAAGNVISMSPAAGTSVAAGASVALVVSSGPATVAVPEVVGLSETAAVSAISTAGLAISITRANSATVPAGTVISQTPAAGTAVTLGSTVAVLISLGPASVIVPPVVGQPEATAVATLTAVGLGSTITRANSATVAAGNVISQNPAGGTSVTPPFSVALVISLGPLPAGGPTAVAAVTSAANGRGNRSVQITTGVPTRLLAFVSADGPQSAGGQTVTVSGGGLTWTRIARANAQFGDAEIWTADAPAALAAASITSTLAVHRAGTDYIQMLRVIAFTGVSGIGASNVASGQTTASAAVSLAAQAAGSVVYAVGEDWSGAVTRTFGAGQVQDMQVLGADGDTFWVQRTSAPLAAAGNVTFTATTAAQAAPGDRWNFAIVELMR